MTETQEFLTDYLLVEEGTLHESLFEEDEILTGEMLVDLDDEKGDIKELFF